MLKDGSTVLSTPSQGSKLIIFIVSGILAFLIVSTLIGFLLWKKKRSTVITHEMNTEIIDG